MTKLTLEESLSMFMAEIAKRLDENTNLIKELRASMDFTFRNQEASIKALEIQVRQMSIILREKLSRNLQSSTVIKPRSNDGTISTFVKADKPSIRPLADLGASVSVIRYSTYTTLGLGDLIPTKLIIELADRIVKRPKGIVENVLVGPTIKEGEVIDTPIKEMVKTRHDDDKITNGIKDYPSFSNLDRKIHVNDAYNLRFFCMIGYEHVDANFFPLLSINMMSKRFYNSIMKDKLEFKRKSIVGAFMNAPIFFGTFSVVTDFAVIEDMDQYRDEEIGDVIVGKPFCKVSCVETKRFDGMITIHGDDESVTYQMDLAEKKSTMLVKYLQFGNMDRSVGV
ncbi:hypothetical protein Tco_0051717 [Tanacetum coccineum]